MCCVLIEVNHNLFFPVFFAVVMSLTLNMNSERVPPPLLTLRIAAQLGGVA